ncbi:MAG: class I SAM-dependent methyltransferase [Chloroflexota bacterium]
MTMDGLRRVPAADIDVVESDPELEAVIRAEIGAGGPMTFARFMELALYHPELGYYRGATPRPGRAGDFLTAPEAHPIFGRALARLAVDVWSALGQPSGFAIREHGAGSGALAAALVDGIRVEAPDLATWLRYTAVEIERRRLEELRGRAGELVEPDDGAPISGLVVANEVLDALPTHRVVGTPNGLQEVFVGVVDGAFGDVLGEPSTQALQARLDAERIELATGQQAEVCLAVDDWVGGSADGLAAGLLLLIDYGHRAADLYDARRRPEGTLAAYLRHQIHHDPYRAVGRQDLTAHVDVTAVERAAAAAGLRHVATTTQSRFLAGLGAGELLVGMQTGPDASLPAYLEARSALVRMIDPAAMGGFVVMAFERELPPDALLRGLRDATRPHQPPPD